MYYTKGRDFVLTKASCKEVWAGPYLKKKRATAIQRERRRHIVLRKPLCQEVWVGPYFFHKKQATSIQGEGRRLSIIKSLIWGSLTRTLFQKKQANAIQKEETLY